ncbi:MAG: acyl carrier protein [Armatimonadota bacterium]|nr:acyl carrier protein [Armatimonadota bacterium]
MTLDTRIVDAVTRVFNVDPGAVSADLKIGDVSEWDSLGQLNLIVEIESVFGTRFDGEQLISLNSLTEIQKELADRNLLSSQV